MSKTLNNYIRDFKSACYDLIVPIVMTILKFIIIKLTDFINKVSDKLWRIT